MRLAGRHIHNIKHIPTAPEQSRLDQVKITSTHIWGALSLNLGPDTVCSNHFYCCTQSFHANAWILPGIGTLPLTSIFSVLYYLPLSICWTLSCSALLMASWRKLQNTLLSHRINRSNIAVGHATKRVMKLRQCCRIFAAHVINSKKKSQQINLLVFFLTAVAWPVLVKILA